MVYELVLLGRKTADLSNKETKQKRWITGHHRVQLPYLGMTKSSVSKDKNNTETSHNTTISCSVLNEPTEHTLEPGVQG